MAKIKVKAKFKSGKFGYYGGLIRNNGDVFEINAPYKELNAKGEEVTIDEFSKTWMEIVPVKAAPVAAAPAPKAPNPPTTQPPKPRLDAKGNPY